MADLVIYETTDYAKFKKLLGNRELTQSRLSAIKESILRIGYQPSPVLVNENYEVIDGQGRLAACEALKLPILYIMKPGLTISDCISMNIKMKNWGDGDYINCYARRGIKPYVDLEKMAEEFPLLNWKQLCDIEGVYIGGPTSDSLRNGELNFSPYSYLQYERARWLSAMIPAIRRSGLYSNRAVDVLIRLDKYKLIDKQRMLESVEKYACNDEFASYRAKDVLIALNEIYNYNRRQKRYFADEYKIITDRRRNHDKEAANA